MELIDGHLVRGDQPLAIEFASTVHAAGGRLVDTLAPEDGVERWVRLHRDRMAVDDGPLPATFAAGDVDGLRRLRDAIRDLLVAAARGTGPEPDAVDRLNRALRRAPHHRELRWVPEAAPVARTIHRAGAAEILAERIASDALDVLTGAHGRLVACGAPSCVLLFVTSDARRTWCSPSCGNRARVARHLQRRRTSSHAGE
jgi:predicted RNA-binding Zn ribbon-like protein